MFSIGERSGLQAGQFSTRTLLLQSHAVEIVAVCGFALSCWNTRRLEGSLCCSKTFIYLSALIVPSKTCKLPCPLRTEISPVFLKLLMMLCTVGDEICKAFVIWRWGTLFLKYSTIFLRTLSQIGEPLPIFTSERLCLSKPLLLCYRPDDN